mmetsp:Transcript_52557/g.112412  ORF Transcript_52557/g.112412 Transcript_52557/m.112412 type:complete len:271 (-) Transcript_52557:138-950(-)
MVAQARVRDILPRALEEAAGVDALAQGGAHVHRAAQIFQLQVGHADARLWVVPADGLLARRPEPQRLGRCDLALELDHAPREVGPEGLQPALEEGSVLVVHLVVDWRDTPYVLPAGLHVWTDVGLRVFESALILRRVALVAQQRQPGQVGREQQRLVEALDGADERELVEHALHLLEGDTGARPHLPRCLTEAAVVLGRHGHHALDHDCRLEVGHPACPLGEVVAELPRLLFLPEANAPLEEGEVVGKRLAYPRDGDERAVDSRSLVHLL